MIFPWPLTPDPWPLPPGLAWWFRQPVLRTSLPSAAFYCHVRRGKLAEALDKVEGTEEACKEEIESMQDKCEAMLNALDEAQKETVRT